MPRVDLADYLTQGRHFALPQVLLNSFSPRNQTRPEFDANSVQRNTQTVAPPQVSDSKFSAVSVHFRGRCSAAAAKRVAAEPNPCLNAGQRLDCLRYDSYCCRRLFSFLPALGDDVQINQMAAQTVVRLFVFFFFFFFRLTILRVSEEYVLSVCLNAEQAVLSCPVLSNVKQTRSAAQCCCQMLLRPWVPSALRKGTRKPRKGKGKGL